MKVWLAYRPHNIHQIWAVDQASYNSWDCARSVDPSRHHERWIKIQRMIEFTHLLLHAMKSHINPPSAIGWSSIEGNDSPSDAWSWPLMAMRLFIQRSRPKINSLNTVLRDGKNCPWNFEKLDLFRHPFHVPFDSLCSWPISASKDYLKSKFDWERKKKSHLGLQFLSSKTQNEKPCIRRLIGSLQRLIWVRLRVFILIFHHLVLILHFES